MTTPQHLAGNLLRVRESIAAACGRARRDPRDVTMVAVTKTASVEAIRALVDLGVDDLGESRVQQLQERAAELAALPGRAVRWHMIGHLQRNKIKAVLDAGVESFHSVDSLRLAEELNERAERMGKRLSLMIQVNCSREPQKFGVAVGAATFLAEMLASLKHVRLTGLMTMGPLSDDPEASRPSFARLRELMDDMHRDGIGGPELRHLSMGMSHDHAVAIEEGATIVRIGSALFAGC
ncbi:MAG: YggS family pyridoxal phosphate-dependent enzyme [Phycisphaerae bacterium]|nr:YggS family pyridoxal phosphate-dependent enzyme [Phycisphaerae bacterium]